MSGAGLLVVPVKTTAAGNPGALGGAAGGTVTGAGGVSGAGGATTGALSTGAGSGSGGATWAGAEGGTGATETLGATGRGGTGETGAGASGASRNNIALGARAAGVARVGSLALAATGDTGCRAGRVPFAPVARKLRRLVGSVGSRLSGRIACTARGSQVMFSATIRPRARSPNFTPAASAASLICCTRATSAGVGFSPPTPATRRTAAGYSAANCSALRPDFFQNTSG